MIYENFVSNCYHFEIDAFQYIYRFSSLWENMYHGWYVLDMKNFYVKIKIQTPLTHMITANFQSYNNK